MSGSIQSEAYLNFRHDSDRARTWLSERKLGGLCHLSKPYWDGAVLVAQLVNPTAGFFSGDAFTIKADIEENAQVALTSPSATRFYQTDGKSVTVNQVYNVSTNAFLEVLPDWSIPQAGSEVTQRTELNIEDGGSCVLLERFMPGRVAHGEAYSYQRFTAVTSIRYAGELQVHERMLLDGEKGHWPLAVAGWDVCYYAALWIVQKDVAAIFEEVTGVEKLFASDSIHCGVSQLSAQVLTIRVICDQSHVMRDCIGKIRKHLLSVLPQLVSTEDYY